MNDRLKSRIEQLRRALEARSDGITLGEFRPAMKKLPRLELGALHAAFLGFSDGGRFGSVDVWSSDELSQNQFRAEVREGGASAWLEVGQVNYEPIFLRRSDGTVELPWRSDHAPRTVSDVDTFFEEYVFGRKYAELFSGAANDRWNAFLVFANS